MNDHKPALIVNAFAKRRYFARVNVAQPGKKVLGNCFCYCYK